MAKFEIYQPPKTKIEGENPIPYSLRLEGDQLQLVAVDKNGHPKWFLLTCTPDEGITLEAGCRAEGIGMPVDEEGRVKIIP